MPYSNEGLEKSRKHRTPEGPDSNLVGPEDPERGNPPPHAGRGRDKTSKHDHATSKDPDDDNN